MAATQLKKITNLAKKIRRGNESWTDAVKRASKQIKKSPVKKSAKKVSGVKKKYVKPSIKVVKRNTNPLVGNSSVLDEIRRQLRIIEQQTILLTRLKGHKDALSKRLVKNAMNTRAAARSYIAQLKKSI